MQPFGSNAPLWSLSYEFWYYIIFPLAMCAAVKQFRLATRIAYFVSAILVILFVGQTIAMYFLIWLFGGAIALSRSLKWSPMRFAKASTLAAAPFVLVLGFSVARPLNSAFLMDAAVALAFGLWIYAIVEANEGPVPAIYAKAAGSFAGFSYTLYLMHFPLLFLLRSRIIRGNVWKPDFVHLLYGLALTAVMVLIAYEIAQSTEMNTTEVRRKVMALFRSTKHPAAAKSRNWSARRVKNENRSAGISPGGAAPVQHPHQT